MKVESSSSDRPGRLPGVPGPNEGRDFTLSCYARIIDVARHRGYRTHAVVDWMDAAEAPGPHLVLRHDVDRWPSNALAMASLEADRGVRATYYFRLVGSAFAPDIIRRIADLGHEIGYHYEDFFLASFDPARAHDLFLSNLSTLRSIAPVRTIAMHGSPLARMSNMEIWRHHDFRSADVRDCILSVDWSTFVYFTDTGRRFDAGRTNMRDEIGGLRVDGIRSSSDVCRFLSEECPLRVQINVHPERWNDGWLPWCRQYVTDATLNLAKVTLLAIRR